MALDYIIRTDIAFTTSPLSTSPIWEDISDYVLDTPMDIKYGRQDEFSTVGPASLSLTLDNSDGRFTPGRTSSPHYPNVKKGRRIRVSVRQWDATNSRPSAPGNMVTPNANFETATVTDYTATNGSFASSTTNPFSGTRCGALTVTASSTEATVKPNIDMDVTVGRQYAGTVRVRAGTTARQVRLEIDWLGAGGTFLSTTTGTLTSTVTTGYTLITVTGTAPAGALDARLFFVVPSASAVAAEVWRLDEFQFDEGASIASFTTSSPSIYYRFDGFVDQWPQTWTGEMADYAEARLTATDRLARLGRASNFLSTIEQEYNVVTPRAYWTLGDGSEATEAGQAAPGSGVGNLTIAQLGSGGTLEFGASTGPGADGLTAPLFTPVDTNNGKYLTASISGSVNTGFTIAGFYNTTQQGRVILQLASSTWSDYLELFTAFGGTSMIGMYHQAGGLEIYGASSRANGQTHHVALTYDGSTFRLYDNGTQVATLATSQTWSYNMLNVGASPPNAPANQCFIGTLAHIGVWSSPLTAAQILDMANAGTGFEGESSNARIARIAEYAGVASTSLDTGLTTSMSALESQDKSPVSLLQDTAFTEAGVVYFDRSGTLVFQSRSRRYNVTPVVTLDVSLGTLTQDLLFVEDDFGLINDATYDRPNGIAVRVQNTGSVTDYDRYSVSGTVLTTSDNEVTDRANWTVQRYGVPSQRCPSVSIDLTTQAALVPSVAPLDISSLIRLTNLPSQAPTSSVDLFVEGYSEKLGQQIWQITYNCSPGGQSSVWTLDSSTYSVLDASTRLAY